MVFGCVRMCNFNRYPSFWICNNWTLIADYIEVVFRAEWLDSLFQFFVSSINLEIIYIDLLTFIVNLNSMVRCDSLHLSWKSEEVNLGDYIIKSILLQHAEIRCCDARISPNDPNSLPSIEFKSGLRWQIQFLTNRITANVDPAIERVRAWNS